MSSESILRDALQAANDAFTAIAMRDGVTRSQVEAARLVRDDASDAAHYFYRDRFNIGKKSLEEQGLAAQQAGVKWWHNLHPSGSIESARWDAGHTLGRKQT